MDSSVNINFPQKILQPFFRRVEVWTVLPILLTFCQKFSWEHRNNLCSVCRANTANYVQSWFKSDFLNRFPLCHKVASYNLFSFRTYAACLTMVWPGPAAEKRGRIGSPLELEPGRLLLQVLLLLLHQQFRPEWELYDRKSDPFELQSVAKKPRYQVHAYCIAKPNHWQWWCF